MPIKYTRDLPADAVASSESMSEVVTKFGGKPTNGSRMYVRQLLDRWGIDHSHFEREGIRDTERRSGDDPLDVGVGAQLAFQ